MDTETTKPKSKRGFASMSKEKQREIARLGGASVPNDRRAFSQNKDLARSAGKKGGAKTGEKAATAKRALREMRAAAKGKGV